MEEMQQNRRQFLRNGLVLCGGVAAVATGLTLLPQVGEAAEASATYLRMGTVLKVTIRNMESAQASDIIAECVGELTPVIQELDRHDSRSAISALNECGTLQTPPRHLVEVLRRSSCIYRKSGGAFDPTVLPLVEALALYPRDSEKLIAELLPLVNFGDVACSPGRISLPHSESRITLDGIAKGYVVDLLSQKLRERGAVDHLINAGGDVYAASGASTQPWRIGIQSPDKEGIATAIILRNGAVATSGNYEHSATHIASRSVEQCAPQYASVSVKASSATEADAVATALFASPDSVAAPSLSITSNNTIHRSPSWG